MGSICTKPGEVVEVGDDKHNLEDIVDCNPDAGFKSKGNHFNEDDPRVKFQFQDQIVRV